jgi:hypothetical protein
MIKRIYITGLIFSFMFATTGYPVTLHLCNMMEEASSSECSMCIDTQIPERMPCCEEFKQEVKNDDSSLIIILSSTTFSINNNVLKSHSPYAFDSSPPSLENNLYISNSVLLI